MYCFLGVLYMYIIPGYITAIERVVTYSETSVCNQTITLGSGLFSSIIDFSFVFRPSQRFSTFSCNFKIETVPGYLIAIKFLSPAYNIHAFNRSGCRTKIIILSNELNIKQCNAFPQTEISSYGNVDIRYEIQRIRHVYLIEDHFKMLLFTYSLQNRIGRCQTNETICVGSRRCIYTPLQCSTIYDFCDNNMKTCQNHTMMEIEKSRSASFSGVYIFLSCLVFLLGVTIYMCFCQGVHFCECICHCCSTLEETGSQRTRRNDPQYGMAQTGNGNEENNDVIVTTLHNESDNEILNDNDSVRSVTFGLPPSYSYVERNASEQNVNEDDTNVSSISEQTLPDLERGTIELPPSYSTVLGHEEEYNVHII